MDFEYCGNGILIYLLLHHQIGWPPPRVDNSPIARIINNVKLLFATGLLVANVAYHPQQALSLRYGPFILAPAVQIVSGLIGNNMREVEKEKQK